MYYKLILIFFLGSGSGSSSSRCTDSSRNCRNWAIQGYCSSNLYTKTNCKKSCNLCREWLCNIHCQRKTLLPCQTKNLRVLLEHWFGKKRYLALLKLLFLVAWENNQHLAMPLVSPRNDIWETSAEIPYWWRVTTQSWVVLLIGWSKFSDNRMQNPDMVSVASSVWNFCPHFWGVISQGHQWWRRVMSAIFSGYYVSFT